MNLKEAFNKEFISRLADEFFLIEKSFQKNAFIIDVLGTDWEMLELK